MNTPIAASFWNRSVFTTVRRLLFAGLLAGLLLPTAASPVDRKTIEIPDAPTLGNYPDTSLPLSTDTTVTPDAAPTDTARITVSTSTNFKGKLEGNPTTGVVRVTNAHPAGTYTVTVRAFDGAGASVTKTFMLTVTTPFTCSPLTFAAAAPFPANSGGASTVGDFNGDGIQDIAVVSGSASTVSILLGNGAGGFGAPTPFGTGTGTNPASVAVGDFNGDGKQDLATANFDSSNVSILLGDGAGNFGAATNFAAGARARAVVVGDFNGDGRQDLAVANFNSANVAILLGNGAGSFASPTFFATAGGPISIALGDFNGDSNQDLVVVNLNAVNFSILLGNGAGSFAGPTNFTSLVSPISVAVGDFNNDGKQDLAVTNQGQGAVQIWVGTGTGSFTLAATLATGSLLLSATVGDFNGDGNQDVAIASVNSYVSIYLGGGAANFGNAINFDVGGGPSSLAVGDFNGDGLQDLAATNSNLAILLRDCTIAPTSAVSRKTHGGAGDFDITLPLSGLPGTLGVECRTGGTTNDYQLVVTYPANVVVNGNPQAQVTSGSGVIGSGGTSNGGVVVVSGNTVTIPLTNVTNDQVINVALNGVNNEPGIINTPAGTGGNLVIPMGVLVGDTNGNKTVNAGDIGQTKGQSGALVTGSNFRTDVNANGSINAGDIGLVKARSGTSIP
jgi:hypothetical protein